MQDIGNGAFHVAAGRGGCTNGGWAAIFNFKIEVLNYAELKGKFKTDLSVRTSGALCEKNQAHTWCSLGNQRSDVDSTWTDASKKLLTSARDASQCNQ